MVGPDPSHVKIEGMPPRPYHHGDLRAALLDAAEALLDAAPARPLSLRDVAKAAGVSHAAPYHHFASLSELLVAIAARAFADLGAAMEGASRADTAQDALVAICETYVDFARARPARFRLMFSPLLVRKPEFPELQRSADESFEVLVRTATAYAPERGAALALTGWSLAHGLANLLIDGAFDGLPVPAPAPDAMARMMALQILQPGAA